MSLNGTLAPLSCSPYSLCPWKCLHVLRCAKLEGGYNSSTVLCIPIHTYIYICHHLSGLKAAPDTSCPHPIIHQCLSKLPWRGRFYHLPHGPMFLLCVGYVCLLQGSSEVRNISWHILLCSAQKWPWHIWCQDLMYSGLDVFQNHQREGATRQGIVPTPLLPPA